MSITKSSMMAFASLGAHFRMDIQTSMDMVSGYKSDLVKVAFPYVSAPDEESKTQAKSADETYDELFGELDEIIKKEESEKAESEVGQVESNDGKLV